MIPEAPGTRSVSPGEITSETGVAAREAHPDDAILGVTPLVVARPESIEEVASLLAWANVRALTASPRGAGTKLDRGNPPTRCDIVLDMSGLAGVIEHAAGDMTVAVRAGTTLAELQAVLIRKGQFLAIDPPVPGTVGGLIATGDSGPKRLRYGGVRDLILGVTFVRPDGTVARGGGKVVKNVAGYDLPKLLTGSLGTLGVVVEANFRLYPIPAASVTTALRVPIAQASKWAASLAGASLVPTAVDYFSGVVEGDEGAAARFETSPVSAQSQAERAAALAGRAGGQGYILSGEDEEALWTEMDSVAVTEPGDVLARLTTTIIDLPLLAERAQRAAREAGVSLTVRAHLRHGHALLRWRNPPVGVAIHLLKQLRGDAEARGSNLVVWRAPAEVRAEVDVWGDPGEGLALMRRVKAQFDPNNILNPGRFVGGI